MEKTAPDLDALLARQGDAFIQAAYFTLFGRSVDPSGAASLRARLESGADKTDLLCELHASAEGQRTALLRSGLCLSGIDAAGLQDTDDRRMLRAAVARIEELEAAVKRLSLALDIRLKHAASQETFIPNLAVPTAPPATPYMAYSTCNATDFTHADYRAHCAALGIAARYHRKDWEHAFIVHHLRRAGVLQPNIRGLGFGVGTERLPAYFASLGASIVATDAPRDLSEGEGWSATGQFSTSLDRLRFPDLIGTAEFDARVEFKPCDMNAIPPELHGFDFNWSSCCFEHLGSIEAGLAFIVNSVEHTLRVGGIACHTTEFNLSSDDETVSSGHTVLFRHRDFMRLADTLRERGHTLLPFTVAPISHHLDGYVDMPPYREIPHLKLQLQNHVTTSAGLVVRRGR